MGHYTNKLCTKVYIILLQQSLFGTLQIKKNELEGTDIYIKKKLHTQ